MAENRTKDNPNEIHTSLGQYFLIKKIAQGGMAEIYKGMASDIHGIQRTVVIKKILPHIAANKEFVDMLVSEAKIAVHLSHGNIAQIYDLGRAGTDYFMVMEYVDGRSLSQIHKRRLKLGELIPLEYILFIASEVANGLDYMHKRTDKAGRPLGIVHRDISPQNIIISYSGTVKIIDFGIAKAAFKVDDSESGILKGKFAYMSPEQARGEDIDSRSDIFSLGVILHELTSGRRLFKDKDNK
jgi:serine/threonine protein kinase